MPENNQDTEERVILGFWTINKTIKALAKEHQLKLPSREIYNITSFYSTTVNDDPELLCEYDPKNYGDPTGEEAIRDWFKAKVVHDLRSAAA